MTTKTTRNNKGSELSWNELDANFNQDVVAVTTTKSVLISENNSTLECSSGPYNVTLLATATAVPGGGTDPEEFIVTIKNTDTGVIIVKTQGSDTLDGVAATGDYELQQNESITVQVNDAIDGYIITRSVHAKSEGKQTIWVPSAAMLPTATNGCTAISRVETTAGKPDIHALAFDPDTDENAQFQVTFPNSWDLGNISAQVYWAHPAATAYNVIWNLKAVAVSNDDPIAATYSTTSAFATDSGGTTTDLYITAEKTGITVDGSPADGDIVYFNISRDANNGSDTLDVSAYLVGVKLFYTTDTVNDA